MSDHDPIVSMRQMLDAAEELLSIAGGMSGYELARQRIVELAATRLLEILGEAANRVPEAIRAGHPEVAWREAIGLRNRLIHGYDSINLDVVAGIVADHIGPLASALRDILGESAPGADDHRP